jgi:hypothetical protein
MGANGGFNKIGYGTVISKAIFKKDLTAKWRGVSYIHMGSINGMKASLSSYAEYKVVTYILKCCAFFSYQLSSWIIITNSRELS